MARKRQIADAALRCVARFAPRPLPASPRSIFVLRNNDLGDVLVATPLFEALRRRFPDAAIAAGVGSWSAPLLERNPWVDRVIPANAPWHNKAIPSGLCRAGIYLGFSDEARAIAAARFNAGIDVLGSPLGSALLLRAGIPSRVGVKGYASDGGGFTATTLYDPRAHVAACALRLASALGGIPAPDPEPRPQLFLSDEELAEGRARWRGGGRRIAIAPGGGFPAKCWPAERFAALAAALGTDDIAIIGSRADSRLAAAILAAQPRAADFTGKLSLRETCALIASADRIACNSSFAMHAAAAFRIPSAVLLGPWYASASEHARQWGYPECRILGPERKGGPLSTPEEAVSALLRSVPAPP